jgi:hypothetical protein
MRLGMTNQKGKNKKQEQKQIPCGNDKARNARATTTTVIAMAGRFIKKLKIFVEKM